MSHANKALFTKQAMYHALKKLITTKSINKITIKDITDTCGLNRQTFYYHFKDIYDLLEWSFQEEFRFICKNQSTPGRKFLLAQSNILARTNISASALFAAWLVIS